MFAPHPPQAPQAVSDFRQQPPTGQFFPGIPGFPIPGADLNRRVRRLEEQQARLEREVDRLNRRVTQLERRIRPFGDGYRSE